MKSMKLVGLALAAALVAPVAASALENPPGAPAAFTKPGNCTTCHSVQPGKRLVGPSLFGIVGRKSASLPDYPYSPAMKGANLTWDEATLTKYLPNPKALVPGTTMTFPGFKDPKDVADVIAFLKTLK